MEPLKGIAAQCVKLTRRQARFILDVVTVDYELRREKGMRRTTGLANKLAAKFGVSPAAIRDIIKRRTWRSLRIENIYYISKAHRDRARDQDAREGLPGPGCPPGDDASRG